MKRHLGRRLVGLLIVALLFATGACDQPGRAAAARQAIEEARSTILAALEGSDTTRDLQLQVVAATLHARADALRSQAKLRQDRALSDSLDAWGTRIAIVSNALREDPIHDRGRLRAIEAQLDQALEAVNEVDKDSMRLQRPNLNDLIRDLSILGLVVLFSVLILTHWGQSRLKSLLPYFGSIEVFGTKLVLDRKSGQLVEDVFIQSREATRKKLRHWVQESGIAGTFHRVVTEACSGLNPAAVGLRATIYVPDPLFKGGLVQLLDYSPETRDQRGKAGRVFSERFGTIGLAWRSNRDQSESGGQAQSADDRVNHWGMTKEEASGQSRHSYYCAVLRVTATDVDSDRLAILYFDAVPQDAFPQGFADRIRGATVVEELRGHLRRYHSELLAASPRLRLFEN